MDVKKLVLENLAALAKKQLLAWLVSKLPFLALPILNPIVSFFLGILVNKLFTKTYIGGLMIYVRIDLSRDLNQMEKLLEEVRAKGEVLTDEEIEKYNEEIFAAGRELYHLNLRS